MAIWSFYIFIFVFSDKTPQHLKLLNTSPLHFMLKKDMHKKSDKESKKKKSH